MRERLLKLIKQADDICSKTKQCEGCIGFGKGEECVNFLIADYLLANGVIVPPCKVGDTVYIIDEAEDECGEDYVLDVKVLQLFINEYGIAVDLKLPLGMRLNTWAVVGKNVFLTREEAEAALKGR